MSHMSTVDAREHFSELINRSAYGKERVVLTRRGKGIAAVIPLEDLNLLEEIEDRLDIEAARIALAEAQQQGTIPLEALNDKTD